MIWTVYFAVPVAGAGGGVMIGGRQAKLPVTTNARSAMKRNTPET